MSPIKKATNAAERYDVARYRARISSLPPDYPLPQPTAAWPPENVALLEQYREWLLSGGASPKEVYHLYIPMAGHALGLNLKPHPQLNLDADLERALDYVKAKGSSAEWIDMCHAALEKFRRFLRQQRGEPKPELTIDRLAYYQAGLPTWLVEQLTRYQHLMQRNWRPARLDELARRFWSGQTRLWHWLCERYPIDKLADVKRQYILDYVDYRLAAGYAVSGINGDLRTLHGFLLFLQTQDIPVPHALLRVRSLKQPDTLPKFLTDEQVRALRDDLEARVANAATPVVTRDALLDRAAFYLLWQGGLRLGELEELRLDDLDLAARKLMVRKGKGQSDRAVYLTDTTVRAVRAYLAVRGMGTTDHVFLYRNLPLSKDLVRGRPKASGERVGVKVYPHRLRHTCATQLLNAGCRVTSIQKFLGHKRLNSTMVYARVHDQTVADDYYSAMGRVEQRLLVPARGQIAPPAAVPPHKASENERLKDDEREQVLDLVEQLAEPELSVEVRLTLVECLRRVLDRRLSAEGKNTPTPNENGRQPRDPPGTLWVPLPFPLGQG